MSLPVFSSSLPRYSVTTTSSRILSGLLPSRHSSSTSFAAPAQPAAPSSSAHEKQKQKETKAQEIDGLPPTRQKMTAEEADAELRRKLEAISGEGGEAGVELEAGKPVGMKRGVRENMFRVI